MRPGIVPRPESVRSVSVRDRMPTGRTTPLGASGGVTGIRFLEQAHVLLYVVALFQERLRVPFAAVDAEEIAAIDVEGAGQARDRIRHRVDDLLSERNGIPHAERPGAGRPDPAILSA